MKNYFLKREGKVEGPYSVDELNNMEIRFSDLVAAEGEPLVWQHPSEIEQLKIFILCEAKTVVSEPIKDQGINNESEKTYTGISRLMHQLYTVRVAAVFVLMIAATLTAKTLVDRFVDTAYYSKYQSQVVHRAEQKQASANFRNALVTKYISPADTLKKNYQLPGKPKDVFKQVKVKGNKFPADDDHPTSLLITVSNESLYLVEKAEVEVAYVDDGEVVASQTFQFRQLMPKGSKTMAVPIVRDGMKVRYKVLNIYTSQYTASQKDV